MNILKLLLYDSDWQALRVGALAQNDSLGGWTTECGTWQNLHDFQAYAEDPTVSLEEQVVRLWRVVNCLNAVRMGYSGQGLVDSKMDQKVLEMALVYRRSYAEEKASYGSPSLQHVKCNTVDDFGRLTAKRFCKLPCGRRVQILENLRQRKLLHAGRVELEWYLDLVGSL